MNKEENKILLKNFIKSNPFDFRQGIISRCRQMDKADVYEWLAEDELKIQKLQNNWNELKKWLEEEIYNIEPKGTAINYNCEYDSEEDYINAMKERSKLITLKRVLIILQELERGEE